MELNSKQVRYLRSLAHSLNPAVQMGKAGYSPALVTEVARNLKDHELIKVRISADDRTDFKAMAEQLADETGAALVQSVGRVVVLYRAGEKPQIRLP